MVQHKPIESHKYLRIWLRGWSSFPPLDTSTPSFATKQAKGLHQTRDTTIELWPPAADQRLVSAANPQVSHSKSQIPNLARKSETTTRAIRVETFLPPSHNRLLNSHYWHEHSSKSAKLRRLLSLFDPSCSEQPVIRNSIFDSQHYSTEKWIIPQYPIPRISRLSADTSSCHNEVV